AILDQPTELTTGDIGIDGEQTLAMPAGAPTTQPTRMPGIGDTIAGFCMEKELGRGGMGVVYEAAHNQTGRRVALKLLSQELAGNAETMARFLREAQLAAALSHPRSTFVFEAGEDQGYPYIVMELMPGRTLKDLADDEGPMSVNRAVDMVLDVIDGLSAAHEAGVIHRDVKPSNCFVDSDGRLKVGDYGLSKSLVTDSDLTQSGSFLGTPLYSAPEQIRGDEVDERTDLYAVGATLFTLIAGRAPFTGESAAVIAQIVSDQPPLLSSLAENIPGDLDRIINRSLHKEPRKRFQALKELRNALAPFATSGSPVADIGRRLAAYMIDSIIFAFLWMVVTFLLGISFGVDKKELLQTAVLDEAGSTGMWVLNLASGVTAAVLYFGICESLWGGGVGKRAVGLRVVSGDGGRPSFLQATGRALCLPGSMVLARFLANTLVTNGVDGLSEYYTTILELCGGWGIVLLLCARMRPGNGFRAGHDQWTNTRITRVRKATSGALLSDIPVLAPVTADPLPTGFGPYETTGALGLMNGRPVFEGRDRQLKR
ncbi:MAG: protein kinase, partial [Planctomycetaceae bacterium]